MATREMNYLSRSNLLAFIKTTMPSYEIGWVHREICGRLMQFFCDVKEKKSPRLILTMPPRHGKSLIVSNNFPSWCFGIDPNISFISSSYSDDLAKRMNKAVQRIMGNQAYNDVFPNTQINQKTKVRNVSYSKTTDLLEIPNYNGSFRSTGIGGGITGMGCDILSIDDPLKDRRSADSPTVRQTIWDWYTSTAYTRLSPGGGVLVTVTRWHEDDLVGRLLEQMTQEGGDQWTVINYPAIAEHDEPHRKKGEALHPQRYPLAMLEKIRRNVGSYDWESLYQQHPSPRSGGIIKNEWILHWDFLPKFFDQIIQSWDFTFKDAANSDNVAGTVWGKVGEMYYLLDCVCEKMDFVSQIRAMKRMTQKWPLARKKVVEDKANGPAVINVLHEKLSGIIPFEPVGSKTARAYSVSHLFESGNVLIPPKDSEHPWVSKYVTELTTFPSAPHDDQVDSTTMALIYLGGANNGRGITGFI